MKLNTYQKKTPLSTSRILGKKSFSCLGMRRFQRVLHCAAIVGVEHEASMAVFVLRTAYGLCSASEAVCQCGFL